MTGAQYAFLAYAIRELTSKQTPNVNRPLLKGGRVKIK